MTTYYKPVSVDEEPLVDTFYHVITDDGQPNTALCKYGGWHLAVHDNHEVTHWLKRVEGVMLSREEVQRISSTIAFLQKHNLASSDIGQELTAIQQLLTSGSEGGEK